jgi:hypothetical protein
MLQRFPWAVSKSMAVKVLGMNRVKGWIFIISCEGSALSNKGIKFLQACAT